jgi:tripeptide aminopeptidase
VRSTLLLLVSTILLADDALLQDGQVKKALAYLESNQGRHFKEQVGLAEVPAPTFHEQAKGRLIASKFRRVGLKDVVIDGKGNVWGWRAGSSPKILVLSAHLDIAFPPGVTTKVRQNGKRWFGPGLADDARGLADLLAIAEAVNHAGIQMRHTVLFLATVGEEGLGNLGGVRHAFENPKLARDVAAFIGIDGTNASDVVNGGLTIKRLKVKVTGPGGHSWGNFGRPSAIHGLSRAAAYFAASEVPASPKTSFNMGRVGGGTSINAIAEQAWIEVDMRSESPGEITRLEAALRRAVERGLAEEGHKSHPQFPLQAQFEAIGDRPGGLIPADHPLIRAALWASRVTSHQPVLRFDSTDANIPISMGIPTVNLGGGGKSDNEHSLEEWFEPENAWRGTQAILLTLVRFDREEPLQASGESARQ